MSCVCTQTMSVDVGGSVCCRFVCVVLLDMYHVV